MSLNQWLMHVLQDDGRCGSVQLIY